MTRCRKSGGGYYNEYHYAHSDRLIAMWRDGFKKSTGLEWRDGWDAGYKKGREVGWREGVLDARYTFENTPVFDGARDRDDLATAMSEAGATETAEEAVEAGATDPMSSEVPGTPEPSLRVVPDHVDN